MTTTIDRRRDGWFWMAVDRRGEPHYLRCRRPAEPPRKAMVLPPDTLNRPATCFWYSPRSRTLARDLLEFARCRPEIYESQLVHMQQGRPVSK